jgi:hypothetical protein
VKGGEWVLKRPKMRGRIELKRETKKRDVCKHAGLVCVLIFLSIFKNAAGRNVKMA